MSTLVKKVVETDLMKHLLEDLNSTEREEFDSWILDALLPIESLTAIIKDMRSTEETSEKLDTAIGFVLSPEGVKEVQKWQEKN